MEDKYFTIIVSTFIIFMFGVLLSVLCYMEAHPSYSNIYADTEASNILTVIDDCQTEMPRVEVFEDITLITAPETSNTQSTDVCESTDIPSVSHIVEVSDNADEYYGAVAVETDCFEETTDYSTFTEDESLCIFTTYTYNDRTYTLPLSEEVQIFTYKMCIKYNVPYRIIIAIMGAETHWNEDPDHVEVHKGTRYIGIGCLTEKYHADRFAQLGINIYKLHGNIEALCIIFRGHMDRYDDNATLATMAYNGGPGYANNCIKQGIYNTSYTDKVNAYAESFK